MNAIGQRTAVATSGAAFPAVPSWAWTYDPLGQVIKADSTVATSDRSYQYDTIGNRQKSANSLTLPAASNYAANSLNQYTSLPSVASVPSYDFDGNMTSGPLPTAPTTNSTLGYDAENRLISCTINGVYVSYLYDALSRRMAKIISVGNIPTVTAYVYDGWNCILEHSIPNGSFAYPTKKPRLWGPDLSGTPQGAGGVGGLLFETPNVSATAPITYPTYDGNGNISEYLSATGTIAAHFEYDPFGNTVVNTDTANLFNYRFSTKPRDQETGLYYYGYRYYDPMTGRWLNRDPIEEKGGMNLYGFVGNRALSLVDFLGQFDIGTKIIELGTILNNGATIEKEIYESSNCGSAAKEIEISGTLEGKGTLGEGFIPLGGELKTSMAIKIKITVPCKKKVHVFGTAKVNVGGTPALPSMVLGDKNTEEDANCD